MMKPSKIHRYHQTYRWWVFLLWLLDLLFLAGCAVVEVVVHLGIMVLRSKDGTLSPSVKLFMFWWQRQTDKPCSTSINFCKVFSRTGLIPMQEPTHVACSSPETRDREFCAVAETQLLEQITACVLCNGALIIQMTAIIIMATSWGRPEAEGWLKALKRVRTLGVVGCGCYCIGLTILLATRDGFTREIAKWSSAEVDRDASHRGYSWIVIVAAVGYFFIVRTFILSLLMRWTVHQASIRTYAKLVMFVDKQHKHTGKFRALDLGGKVKEDSAGIVTSSLPQRDTKAG